MNSRGLLLIVSGPAGAGKGTICGQFILNNKSTFLSVSATTRKPREGEAEGINYFFVSKQRFEEMIANDELLEYACFCENYYGTPKSAIEARLEKGEDVILEIEVQGALQVKEKYPEAIMLFVLPPSFEILRERLIGRGTETPEVVEKRLNRSREEMMLLNHYDYIIINDDINLATARLQAVVTAEKAKTKNIIENIREAYDI